jgi:NmrA-like family
VAEKFLSLGWNVRGITRSASSASAVALAAKGVTLVEADIDNPSTLIPAFSGAHVIFGVTDFWAPFFASYEKLSQISDRATGEHAFAIEVKRGKGIVDAVEKVLKEEGVLERFVFSTLPGFTELSGGKYTYAYHFDGKAEISRYSKGKREVWERSSLLNMGFYTTNLVKMGKVVGFGKVCP